MGWLLCFCKSVITVMVNVLSGFFFPEGSVSVIMLCKASGRSYYCK